MLESIAATLIGAAVLGAWTMVQRRRRIRMGVREPLRATFEQVVRAPWGVAFPDDLPDASEFEARHDTGQRDAYEWLRSAGGIDHRETKLRLFLVGAATHPVLVRDIRIASTRLEPFQETLVECATGGAISSTVLMFDLDDDDPDAWEGIQPEFEAPKKVGGAPYFERASIELAPGEHHDLLLVGQASRFRVDWRLEVHVLVDGRESIVRLDDNGEPFRTNGLRREHYARCLEWIWYESPPHFGTPPDYG